MPNIVQIEQRKRLAVRNELIRRQNVKRHAEHIARTKLKDDQNRAQRVATWQQELDRLHAASIHGSGLDAIRANRMTALKEMILKKKHVNEGPGPEAALRGGAQPRH